jgi:hypothetical protein
MKEKAARSFLGLPGKKCPDRWKENAIRASPCVAVMSVDGAKILVVRLREIGRVGHHTKWINGDAGSFADGRFDPPGGDYKSDCEYRESDAEQSAHVRSPMALRKSANAPELCSH